MTRLISIALLPWAVAGFAGMSNNSPQPEVSRRESLAKVAFGILGGVSVSAFPAFAEVLEETPKVSTRMGGLLVRFSISIMREMRARRSH